MGYAPMFTNLSRGGAAALFTIIVVALPLGAQSGAVAPSRIRDTSGVVEIRVMTKARLDTIRTLMRSFEDARPGTVMWDSVRKQIEALMPTRLEFRRTTNPAMAPAMASAMETNTSHRLSNRTGLNPESHYRCAGFRSCSGR